MSLAVALVLGTAGLPHIVTRFYTVPDGRAARTSVNWAIDLPPRISINPVPSFVRLIIAFVFPDLSLMTASPALFSGETPIPAMA